MDEGIDALERAALIKPSSVASSVELAIGYGVQASFELVCDLLMIQAVSGKCSATNLLRIATGLELVGRPRLALEACRMAGRINPSSAEIQHRMAGCVLKCN